MNSSAVLMGPRHIGLDNQGSRLCGNWRVFFYVFISKIRAVNQNFGDHLESQFWRSYELTDVSLFYVHNIKMEWSIEVTFSSQLFSLTRAELLYTLCYEIPCISAPAPYNFYSCIICSFEYVYTSVTSVVEFCRRESTGNRF